MLKKANVVSAIALVAILSLAPLAFSATLYTAVMDGASAGTLSPATGTATLTLNDAGTEVSYEIVFSGLQGTETAAHFHNGAPGSLGPVMLALPMGSPKVGVWPVGAFEVGELNAGRVYINIHTSLYPTGEIRGDVHFEAVANESVSWGSIKALYQ